MTLNQLKVFEAVSTYLSITRASQALRISEPSVFQQVKSLEDWIGAKLYRKVGRVIELTREGRAIQSEVKEVLLKLEQLAGRFRAVDTSLSGGSLIIGGSHGPSVTFLPSVIAAFKKDHSSVQVVLRTKSSRTIERLVLGSDVEIALLTTPSRSPQLQAIPYRREKFVSFISAKHPLAKKHKPTIADVAQCPLIVKKSDQSKSGNYVKQIESAGFHPNVLMECESAETIKLAVMNGMGLGFLYHDHLKSEIKRGELKLVKIAGLRKPYAESFIVYRKDKILSANGKAFLELLLRARDRRKPAVITSAQKTLNPIATDRQFLSIYHRPVNPI